MFKISQEVRAAHKDTPRESGLGGMQLFRPLIWFIHTHGEGFRAGGEAHKKSPNNRPGPYFCLGRLGHAEGQASIFSLVISIRLH